VLKSSCMYSKGPARGWVAAQSETTVWYTVESGFMLKVTVKGPQSTGLGTVI
jgi:hypothetical protein